MDFHKRRSAKENSRIFSFFCNLTPLFSVYNNRGPITRAAMTSGKEAIRLEESDIVALYWARDEAAITECERKFGAECRRIAGRILDSPQDAEECVSDTWLRAWNSIPPARPEKLSAFLLKITRNLALDRIRNRRAEKRGGGEAERCLEELEAFLPEGDDPPDEIILRDLMERFVRTLKPGDRTVFLLRYVRIETVAEIASRTGKKQNAVKASLFRTRKKLRDYLKKEGIDV